MTAQQTITSHLNSLTITNTMTYADGNPDPGLRQAQQFGRVKLLLYQIHEFGNITLASKGNLG